MITDEINLYYFKCIINILCIQYIFNIVNDDFNYKYIIIDTVVMHIK